MTEVQAKSTSKAELAKAIFDELHQDDADLDGLSIRACFIKRAMAETGLTKNGASTYYQNFMNEARGKKRYSYTPSRKKAADAQAEAGADLPTTKQDILDAEAAVQQTIDTNLRWHIINENGDVVGAYSSRTKARNELKDGQSIRDSAVA